MQLKGERERVWGWSQSKWAGQRCCRVYRQAHTGNALLLASAQSVALDHRVVALVALTDKVVGKGLLGGKLDLVIRDGLTAHLAVRNVVCSCRSTW